MIFHSYVGSEAKDPLSYDLLQGFYIQGGEFRNHPLFFTHMISYGYDFDSHHDNRNKSGHGTSQDFLGRLGLLWAMWATRVMLFFWPPFGDGFYPQFVVIESGKYPP